MSYYYDYYLGRRNSNTGEIAACAPYNSDGKPICLMSKSSSLRTKVTKHNTNHDVARFIAPVVNRNCTTDRGFDAQFSSNHRMLTSHKIRYQTYTEIRMVTGERSFRVKHPMNQSPSALCQFHRAR